MKNLLVLVLVCFGSIVSALNVEVSSFSFYSSNPYTEIYFRVDGNTVEWKKNDEVQQASVELIVIISQSNGDIVAFDKFSLKSVVKDSLSDFLGVKRFKIKPGEYIIKVEAVDGNLADNTLEMEQKFIVDAPKEFQLSDILLLSKLKKDNTDNPMIKNGFYLEPLSYQYSNEALPELDFYVESYLPSTLLPGDHFLKYSINEGFYANLNSKSVLTKYRKINLIPVDPMILSYDVSTLRSGDYHISISIIDKQKKILCEKRVNFTRSNPAADIAYLESYNETLDHSFVQQLKADEMDYILKAHLPVTEQHQVSTLGELLKSNKLKSQRQFVYQYWKTKSPANPEEAYKKYMDVAQAVDNKFYSNVGYGFQSDRGHIFLKYGKPTNVLTVDTEVDAPPYEIWYYNYMPLSRQTNVRFLFYNPTLAHNDFKLLHSTCLGERSNPAWETELYKSVPRERLGNTVDATQVGDNWNRNARRYFNEY